MSHKIGTMREFNTKNFKVVCDALEEDDLDLSFDEDGSTRKGLKSGALMAFVARVRVFFQGKEVGADYLGGCIYKSLEDFMDHRECFHYMICEAIGKARKNMLAYQTVRIRNTEAQS